MRIHLAFRTSFARPILLALGLTLILASVLYSTGVSAHSKAIVSTSTDNHAPYAWNSTYTLHNAGLIGEFSRWDPDGDSLTASYLTQPSHGTLDTSWYGTYRPWYSPTPGYSGQDSFVYQVCDPSNACATGTITVNITNQAPYAWPSSYSLHNAGLIGEFGRWDPDGDSVTGSIVTQPSHGTLNTSWYGTFRPWYEPTPGYSGQDSFVYRVCDTFNACSDATITVNITNQAPSAYSGTYTLHNAGFIGEFGRNDPEGDSVTGSIITPPANGTINTSWYGTFRPWYTPNPGFSGLDTLTFQVCDSFNACSSAVVTIQVVNQAPYARDSIYKLSTDNGGYIGYFSSWDPDSDSLTASIVTQPSHGTLYDYGSGPLRPWYFPSSGYPGPDSFVYQICDPFGACARGTIYVNDDDANAGATSCNAHVGGPINVSNGNMYLQETDYQLPGVGEAINLTRTYNSNSSHVNLFGRGWSSTYDEAIKIYSNSNQRLFLPDGRAVDFTGTGTLTPVQGDFHGQLVQNGNGSYTLTLKDGSIHQFNAAGKLTSLADRNNNQTLLAYDANGNLASITDAFGRVLTVTSDTNERVLSISDSVGVIATYTYDSGDQLLSVIYADGSGYQFSYNSSNLLASVTDALGHILESHTYDSQGRALTSQKQGGVELFTLNYVSNAETDVTDALNHVTKYFFDKSHGHNVVTRVDGVCSCGGTQSQTWAYDNQLNVTSKTNALGQTISYTYNADGNALTVTNALGITTFTYNSFGQILTATDSIGRIATYTYDVKGNLLSAKDALNNETLFAYDQRGLLQTVTDARQKTTSFAYDTSGNLTQETDAANNNTALAYDARSRIVSSTDALNHTSSVEYDPAGRIKKVIAPDNTFSTFTYDLAGRRISVTDARNNTTTYGYDSANRLTSITNADNKVTAFSFDLMSNLSSVTDALNRTTNYEYDSFNRLNKIIHPPAVSGATRLTKQIAYDAGNHVASRTDEAGRVTSYDYDSTDRLIKVTDPVLQATQYEYNARSQTTAVMDALNQRYTFAYDAVGHVTQVTRGGVSMSYSYDVVGNRTGRTDYNSATTTYAYDNLNQLTTITYPDTTNVSYDYDALSRLNSANNENGTASFSYDNRGLLSSTTDVFNQTVGYSYDENGNRMSLSLGQTTNATYQYDVLNRLTQLTDGNNASITLNYDATSRLASRTLPNGVTASYQYDGLDRLTRMTDATSTSTVADAQYQYNTASQVTQIAEPAQTRNFTYDLVNRLTSVTNPTQTVESYTYDAVGNRIASQISSTYSYQPFDKVITIGSTSYSYDNNGNLTQKIDSSGMWAYTWDYENRLKQVTRPDGQTISYKYDALGRRIQRVKGVGVTTNYIYDGEDVIKDINSDGSTVEYLNGLGIDDKLRQTSSAGTVYFSQDHLGSTRALTDTSGNVVESVSYDSFGNGSSSLTRYGYTGREWDAEANLYYYRNRWYDPQAGRFISEDPIGLSGGMNMFSYVSNNPVNKTDPSGLYEDDVHYYLTYYLASKQGCFSSGEAKAIAEGNIQTDYDPAYSPGARRAYQNATYHALHGGSHTHYLQNLWDKAMQGNGNLEWLGRYLHYVQDIYSHMDFTNSDWGHSPVSILYGDKPGTHLADKTEEDVHKAQQMVASTWKALNDYALLKKGCGCKGNWTSDMWPTINRFLEAPSGPSSPFDWVRRTTSLSPDSSYTWGHLENKRRILGVPRR